MRIAVTGAAGLLGRYVVAAVTASGHMAQPLDKVAISGGVSCDVTDHDAFMDAIEGADALIHLAAITTPLGRPAHMVYNSNVTASFNALDAAIGHNMSRVVMASSVNAIGGHFSRYARYDYFAVDEQHPSYCEDPYGLSKRTGELQADAMVTAHAGLSVVSLRYHVLLEDRTNWIDRQPPDRPARDLWGWTPVVAAAEATVRACTAPIDGHEILNLVAGTTLSSTPSGELAARNYPEVPLHKPFTGNESFHDSTRARELLDWKA